MRPHAVSVPRTFALMACLASPALAEVPSLDMPVEARFDGDVSVGNAYGVLGGLADIRFVFDEGVRRDEPISLDVHGLSMRQALDVLDLSAGVFRQEVSPGVQIIAPDNTTKRREYEVQSVRTFYLEHAEVKTVNALLRGIVDVRKTAIDEATRSLTIRDTASKVALAAELVSHFDVERPTVGLEAQLWLVSPARAEELRSSSDEAGVVPTDRIDKIRSRSGVQVLASQQLGTVDGRSVVLEIDDEGELSLAVKVTPTLHLETRESTLELAASIRQAQLAGASAPASERRVESTARLEETESFVIVGLMTVDSGTLRPRTLMSEAPDPKSARELVIVVTPRVGAWPSIPAAHRAPLLIGTDKNIRFPAR